LTTAAPGPARRHVVTVMQPNYLPWLGYFDLIALADTFVVYDDVQFDKHGWRNRNRLYRHPDPLWLTAPVVTAGRMGQDIRDVRLADGTWPEKHLKTVRQVYARAPHFDWCFPALEAYLGGKSYAFLVDLCLDGHRALAQLLALDTPLRLSSELGFRGAGKTERLVAICQALGASRYLATSAGREYLDEPRWTAAGIELAYQDYPHPVYPQFGADFVSHLSVVDALMFVGPETRAFLRARPTA